MNDKTNLSMNKCTTIGSSISITGDINGQEDIFIDGNVEGSISFKENKVEIGANGKVNANINAKFISVSGDVKGELRAGEQVSIKPMGKVTGDIRAPSVVLSDGCQFKGAVDMEEIPVTSERRANKLNTQGSTPPVMAHPLKNAKLL